MNDRTLVFDTPEKIAGVRLLTLRSAFKLELVGIKVYRNVSIYALIKREFGLKGNKQSVFDQFTDILCERGILFP
jgi:hypothetical protein